MRVLDLSPPFSGQTKVSVENYVENRGHIMATGRFFLNIVTEHGPMAAPPGRVKFPRYQDGLSQIFLEVPWGEMAGMRAWMMQGRWAKRQVGLVYHF
jgi:hypothetical protein